MALIDLVLWHNSSLTKETSEESAKLKHTSKTSLEKGEAKENTKDDLPCKVRKRPEQLCIFHTVTKPTGMHKNPHWNEFGDNPDCIPTCLLLHILPEVSQQKMRKDLPEVRVESDQGFPPGSPCEEYSSKTLTKWGICNFGQSDATWHLLSCAYGSVLDKYGSTGLLT